MEKQKIKIFSAVLVILVLGVVATAVFRPPSSAPVEDGRYDAFAQCLADRGVVFYGTFWCKYCKAQKKLFGSSQKLLSYVECSTPDAKAQTPLCLAKEIKTYPTWEFVDGERRTGVLPLEELAGKTGCVLPEISE